jgi:hypothetical protein
MMLSNTQNTLDSTHSPILPDLQTQYNTQNKADDSVQLSNTLD